MTYWISFKKIATNKCQKLHINCTLKWWINKQRNIVFFLIISYQKEGQYWKIQKTVLRMKVSKNITVYKQNLTTKKSVHKYNAVKIITIKMGWKRPRTRSKTSETVIIVIPDEDQCRALIQDRLEKYHPRFTGIPRWEQESPSTLQLRQKVVHQINNMMHVKSRLADLAKNLQSKPTYINKKL